MMKNFLQLLKEEVKQNIPFIKQFILHTFTYEFK